MANSKYEYVRQFEQSDILLPNTWTVVRIDGRGFTKLCARYGFAKPNDKRALDLMNAAAKVVVADLPDISLAYGVSDEYSFVFHKTSQLFERRASKLVSTVVSTFTAAYVFLWPTYFPDVPLGTTAAAVPVVAPIVVPPPPPPPPTVLTSSGSSSAVAVTAGLSSGLLAAADVEPGPSLAPVASSSSPSPSSSLLLPTFDGRAVCYPSVQNLRDYLSWRQVDCHINNLYNTTLWALVLKGGLDSVEATKLLKGTVAADKNEILFSRFGINYNNEPEMFKKGSVVFRDYELVDPKSHRAAEDADNQAEPAAASKSRAENDRKRRSKARITVEHLDIIKDDFWDRRPWLLTGQPGRLPKQL